MSRRRWEVVIWLAVLATAGWGRLRWKSAIPPALRVAAPVIAPVPQVRIPALAPLEAEARVAAARNPFRLDRSPAPVMATTSVELASAPPPPVRPPLAVSGLVGPPWAAVLEGVPGREEGAVVRGGEQLGELTVRSVSATTVVVVGPDTTWRLTMRRSWQ
jgi:hypothetical protein